MVLKSIGCLMMLGWELRIVGNGLGVADRG